MRAPYVRLVPGWVMLGVNHGPDRGVAIYASSELTEAELEWEIAEIPTWGSAFREFAHTGGLTITARGRTYVVASGRDWREAFANLFDVQGWQPDNPAAALPATQAQLGPAVPALGGE